MIKGGPSTVTRGLIWEIDPANPKSYANGSSVLYNMVEGRGSGSIVSVTYSPLNGGCFSFDGTNAYVAFAPDNGVFARSTPNFSYGGWFWFDNVAKSKGIFSYRNDSPYNQYGMAHTNDATVGGNGTKLCAFLCPDAGSPYVTFNYELSSFGVGWYYGMVVIDATIQKLYVNGRWVVTDTQPLTGTVFLISGRWGFYGAQNVSQGAVNRWDSYLSLFHLYGVTLTSDEVLQNYNATKGRFGRT